MASIQEPEVQFAQRLASNEKPIRTKAIKKLRKYITVRSQKEAGGFTGDELLKLWKGLFYCLWMQDKPLLQEELSNQISSLINSFQNVDGQLLYFQSFLQTFKREWTGIDRLRMDKFFQLVRFMFRQTFEQLKKRNWDSSEVSRFLELLATDLLQSNSEAPGGLQLHILDLYMTELAAVGSSELTADQNLVFIEPFCKTAAKTKDRSLFGAICNSIFSVIIDQAPFAIADLMKEVEAAHNSDSDSGQASEEDEDEEEKEETTTTSKPVSKKGKQINGKRANKEDNDDEDGEENDDFGDEDDDELLHLEDSDTEEPEDEDIGPVLQFDYAALADKLFELASRGSTPSHNRQRLYKIIQVLRNLSEGVFPQDEYPEEVSTDEDDDMFGSRKRIKKGKRRGMDEEEEEPAAKKKKKGKKKEGSKPEKQNKGSGKDDSEAADQTVNSDNKKKKKKRKKKKKKSGQGEQNTKPSETGEIVAASTSEDPEGGQTVSSQEKDSSEEQSRSSVSFVKVTDAATADGPSETLLLSEVKKQPSVSVTEESSQQTPGTEQAENLKNKQESDLKPEAADKQHTETEISSGADVAVSEKKKKKKKGLKSQADVNVVEAEIQTKTPETPANTKTGLKAEQEREPESHVNGANAEEDFVAAPCEDSERYRITDSLTSSKKRRKKKSPQSGNEGAQKVDAAAKEEENQAGPEIPSQEKVNLELKKKAKKRSEQEESAAPADESAPTPLKKKKKRNEKESEALLEEEAAEVEATQVLDAEKAQCEISTTTSAKKKKKKPAKETAAAQVLDIKDPSEAQVSCSADTELPLGESEVLSSSRKAAKKKKRKIPVVFEFEADELQAAAVINGLAQEETNGGSDVWDSSTPLSSKKSKKKAKASPGSDFITFQRDAAVPTPLFCKTKGSPSTPLSSKKRTLTPKSESKKVTFGLKNNKTAEFRKTDRSLLVSPDGSSRVPFDPQQKPKFGVLKSPTTPLNIRVKKTPNSNRKGVSKPPKSTQKKRPTAADFF